MANISQVLLCALQSRIGPVTSYIRKGKAIIRTAYSHPDGKITPARTAQREKLKLCKAFTDTGFFNRTFPSKEAKGTGYNRATASILGAAIKGEGSARYLSYSNVPVSGGTLPPPASPSVKKDYKSNLIFTWLPNPRTRIAKASDKAVLVAFHP